MAEPPKTSWGSHDFPAMYKMVHAGDASRMRLAATGWDALGLMLGRLSHNMIVYRNEVAPMWDSPAGDVFVGKMADFSSNASTYSQGAYSYGNALRDCADALEVAQKEMNRINVERQKYIKTKQDYNNLADHKDDFLANVGDVVHDVGANIVGANHIDPARLREFDDEAATAMGLLADKYLSAASRMHPVVPYTGPVVYVPTYPQGFAPGMPGAPSVGPVPAMPPVPIVPMLPTAGAPPPVLPVMPNPSTVPPGPTLAGGPSVPVAPGQLAPPAPPPLPGLPGSSVAPFLPNNVGKVTPPSAPGLPPPPGSGRPGRTGTPPPPGSGRPGVIGKRPGQPGAPGQQGRAGKTGTPPPAGNRNNRRGVIGGQTTPPDQRGRTGTPPPAGGQQRRGVIGKRPGVDDPGTGRPGRQGGTPPPAGRQRGRGTGGPGTPAEPHGTGPAAGRAAHGTPPPTIGNTSRPPRPADLDHRVLGRPDGARPTQPDEPTARRPGIAARKDAASPVVGGSQSAGDPGRRPEERVRARRPVADPSEGELGIVEQLAPPPVIESPEQTHHGKAERGPAIGGTAG